MHSVLWCVALGTARRQSTGARDRQAVVSSTDDDTHQGIRSTD